MKPIILAAGLLWALLSLPSAFAADTVLTDFDGQPQTIESYTGQGKWLVVMVWAHDCHVCNQEAEGYAQFHAAHQDSDATVLGVSIDGAAGKADAEAFIERHDLPFPNLIGEPVPTMLHYSMLTESQFLGTPSFLLFDPQGTLRAAQAGAVPTTSIEAYMEKNRAGGGAG